MSDKDLDNDGLLSINEFAELVGMTVSALRHYDKEGVFHPAQRGKDGGNLYRYYTPMQITAVKMIRVLSEIGVPLKTIKQLGAYRAPTDLIKLLSENRHRVVDEIQFLQEVSSVIGTFLDLLYEGISANESDISVLKMPEKQIILGDKNDFNDVVSFYREFTCFCNAEHSPKLNMSYPIGGYFESMEVFLSEPSRPTRFFSVDPKGHEKKEAGLYLVGYTRGYYGQTNDLSQRMAAYAKKNGIIFSGPVYNIFLFDEISISDSSQYLLQASASVTETRRVPSRYPRRSF